MPAWGRGWHQVFRPQPGTFTSQPCGGLEPGRGQWAGEPGGRVGRGFRCGRAGEGPGAWNIRRPLSAAAQCFLCLSTQNPGGFKNCGGPHSPPKRRLAPGRLWGHRGHLIPGSWKRGSSPAALPQRPGPATNHPPQPPATSRVPHRCSSANLTHPF